MSRPCTPITRDTICSWTGCLRPASNSTTNAGSVCNLLHGIMPLASQHYGQGSTRKQEQSMTSQLIFPSCSAISRCRACRAQQTHQTEQKACQQQDVKLASPHSTEQGLSPACCMFASHPGTARDLSVIALDYSEYYKGNESGESRAINQPWTKTWSQPLCCCCWLMYACSLSAAHTMPYYSR
jgi:hypothetical protein